MLLVGGITSAESLPEAAKLSRFERSGTQMGVPFRMVVYATNQRAANKAMSAAFDRIAELNGIFSDYDSDSELSRLSRSSGPGNPVTVSPELRDILQVAQKISRQSDGAFDVTVGPFVRLWRRARRQREPVDPKRLADARQRVGYELLKIDTQHKTVELQRDNMRLDLGGIAKGYAADEAMKVLQQHAIHTALIDASGDLLVSDPPPGKSGWTIGIAALKTPGGKPTEYLEISNTAVATSGDAYQYVEIDGVRYSHIIDPTTGVGLTTQSSVTVVAPTATQADAWASAVSVLGPEQGLRTVSSQKNITALVVTLEEGKRKSIRSCGFPKTFKKQEKE
jgi:thiamine biosynthesis lipoprotein